MTCYLVRHGKDDDTVRGGWSDASLTEEGIAQVKQLAQKIKNDNLEVEMIFASDLQRAIDIPITYLPAFREVNNGDLAGMKNELAKIKYPGLYWNTLEWDQHYPNGESPKAFYQRICNAWQALKTDMATCKNVMLVTHGGVINVILHIEKGLVFSNKGNAFPVPNATLIEVGI